MLLWHALEWPQSGFWNRVTVGYCLYYDLSSSHGDTIPLDWEVIDENIARTKVFGGWLIKNLDTKGNIRTFVYLPDPGHEWVCEAFARYE